MPDSTSLIKGDDQQLPLFGSDQMDPAFFSNEEKGFTPKFPTERVPEFTGARLFSANPDKYKSIVALSAEGLGAIRIGRILKVSPNTVLAVRAREPESIDIEKKRLASLSREGARMCVEGIIEMLSDPKQLQKISLKDKGIVFNILSEKSELLSGSPTARLQTIGTPEAVECMEYMRQVRAEYDRRMGLGGGKKEQRAVPDPVTVLAGNQERPTGVDPDLEEINAEKDEQGAIVAPGPPGVAVPGPGRDPRPTRALLGPVPAATDQPAIRKMMNDTYRDLAKAVDPGPSGARTAEPEAMPAPEPPSAPGPGGRRAGPAGDRGTWAEWPGGSGRWWSPSPGRMGP